MTPNLYMGGHVIKNPSLGGVNILINVNINQTLQMDF